jgi:uncharacterized protein YgiM (DUF1202 family)
MNRFRKVCLTLVVGLWVSTVAAQEDCPTIVRTALDATDAACEATSRNQACYGNTQLEAIPQEGIEDFNFEQPGDIVDVVGVSTLTLQPLSGDVWGVALMRLQANIPETLPGQNVTFLLFGDVDIRNAVETNVEPITVNVTSTGDINVRSGPSTSDQRIAGLSNGETVVADGRNPDSSWLRIQLSDGNPGWVSADLVTVEDDITLLNVVDPLALPPPPLNPMQAFYFKSGIGDAPCEEAPDSGILIQTPEGVGTINLTVNEVDIQLGSTAYLQAQASGDMTVNVVENQATVSAQGTTRFVPAGSRVRVPLDANLAADGPPSEPEPYDNADLAAVPVSHMPRRISVAPALTQAEIDAMALTLPVSGNWLYTTTGITFGGDCAQFMDASMVPEVSEVITLDGFFSIDPAGNFQNMQVPDFGNPEFENPEPGVFVSEFTIEGATFRYEIHVLSPTQIVGSWNMDMAQQGFSCSFHVPFTMVAQSSE